MVGIAAVLALLSVCSSVSAFEQEGLASWYGGKFQGRQTASGEIFDTNQHTGAHKTLAFGTVVRVLNLENGKSTIVRINDRGPFVAGRIIDLSRAAAVDIALAGRGVAKVRLEVLSPESPEAIGLAGMPTPLRYSIQIAAFRNREYADRELERVSARGFRGELEQTSSGIYRVLIRGVEEGHLEATKLKLRDHGWSDVVARPES